MINFFINLSPWIAAGFAITAALTWKIPKGRKEFLKISNKNNQLLKIFY